MESARKSVKKTVRLHYDGGIYIARLDRKDFVDGWRIECDLTICDVVVPSGTVCELQIGDSIQLSKNAAFASLSTINPIWRVEPL